MVRGKVFSFSLHLSFPCTLSQQRHITSCGAASHPNGRTFVPTALLRSGSIIPYHQSAVLRVRPSVYGFSLQSVMSILVIIAPQTTAQPLFLPPRRIDRIPAFSIPCTYSHKSMNYCLTTLCFRAIFYTAKLRSAACLQVPGLHPLFNDFFQIFSGRASK